MHLHETVSQLVKFGLGDTESEPIEYQFLHRVINSLAHRSKTDRSITRDRFPAQPTLHSKPSDDSERDYDFRLEKIRNEFTGI